MIPFFSQPMSLFSQGLWITLGVALLVWLVWTALGWRHPRRPVPRRDLGTPLVFGLGLAALVVRHQWVNPSWVPTGSDWDTWFQAAAAIRGEVTYPTNRWPLYGAAVSLLDLVVPGQLTVNAQLTSMVATAGSAAAIYRFSRTLLGWVAGLAAAVLCLAHPLVMIVGSWTNAYALWACAGAWCVTGGLEGMRTGKARWWLVCGLGLAGVFAAMPKGIALGLALGALWTGGVVLRTWWLSRNLACLWLPVALTAMGYAAFPHELQSLDAHIENAAAQAHNMRSGPRSQNARASGFGDTTASVEGGYIFGQAMDPITVTRSLSRASRLTTPAERAQRLDASLSFLTHNFPAVGRGELQWLGLGALASLGAALSTGMAGVLGWLGITGSIASVSPSVFANIELRFLMPAMVLLPVLVVAPLALLTRRCRWGASLLPLALVGVITLPGSPWLPTDRLAAWSPPVFHTEETGVWLYHEVMASWPGVRVHAMGPPALVLVLAAETGGQLLIPDVSSGSANRVELPAEDYLIRWTENVEEQLHGWIWVNPRGEPPVPASWSGLTNRRVVQKWTIKGNSGLILLGPIE